MTHRLQHAAVKVSSPSGPPNNSVYLGLEQAPDRFSFAYDAAQNLISRQEVRQQSVTTTPLPPDASGRNRPGSIGSVSLEYDANGNLKRKGTLRFYYDFRNRLSRVTDDQGTEVATYEYDAFNRRVKAHLLADDSNPARTVETVWSGWRELEQYRNGVLHQRFTRGPGIDEIVRLEADQDLNGQMDAELVPHYDETGNLVLLTGLDDKIVAEYGYTPFGGDITARADAVAPEVEQVIVRPDRIELEFSEEHLLPDDLGISGRIELLPFPQPLALGGSVVTKSTPITIEVTQPVQEGRTARRRLVIRPTTAPTVGEQVQLTLQPDAVRDLLLNPMSAVFQTTVTWPASGSEVVSDTTDPEVEELRLRDGQLELVLSEPPDLASASSLVEVDGAALAWTLESDGYTLRSVDPLAVGAHLVTIAAGASLDRAGKGLALEFSESVTVTAGVENEEYFAQADSREMGMEALVNRFSLHGRPLDLETGLVYFRNRYYDPEMGRFITKDPLGYVDGPSAYAFAMNSPVNFGDPFGLYVVSDQVVSVEEYLAELRALEALMLAERREKDPEATVTAQELIKRQIQLLKEGVRRKFGGVISNNRFVLVDDFPIDMKHFLKATVLGDEYGYLKTQWGSFGDELIQSMSAKEGTRLSALSPEDMPSNFMGAHFGGKRFDARGESLADQLEREFAHIERWRVIWGVYGRVPEARSPEWLEIFDYDINFMKPVPPPKEMEDFNWFQQQLIKQVKKAKEDL